MKQILLTIGAIICLAVVILSAGIIVCFTVPQITENLSRATAMVDTAHFTRDQLVDVACKTRAFVAGQADKNDLYNIVSQINKDAKTEFADCEPIDFAAVNEEFSLNQEAILHLEDVQTLFANIKIAFGLCAFGSVLFCALLLVICGSSALGRAFC